VNEKPHYKGKGKLTESMRKQLTKAARCAIKMRSAHTNKGEAAKLLRQDLRNGPFHCFGDHSQCSTDYCKVAQRTTNEQTTTEHPPSRDTTSTAAIESDMAIDITSTMLDIVGERERANVGICIISLYQDNNEKY